MSRDFPGFLRELKTLVDTYQPYAYEANGPMRIRFLKHRDSKHKERHSIRVEAGWDHNYGGTVVVEASPTGKSLTVFVSPEVRVVRMDA